MNGVLRSLCLLLIPAASYAQGAIAPPKILPSDVFPSPCIVDHWSSAPAAILTPQGDYVGVLDIGGTKLGHHFVSREMDISHMNPWIARAYAIQLCSRLLPGSNLDKTRSFLAGKGVANVQHLTWIYSQLLFDKDTLVEREVIHQYLDDHGAVMYDARQASHSEETRIIHQPDSPTYHADVIKFLLDYEKDQGGPDAGQRAFTESLKRAEEVSAWNRSIVLKAAEAQSASNPQSILRKPEEQQSHPHHVVPGIAAGAN